MFLAFVLGGLPSAWLGAPVVTELIVVLQGVLSVNRNPSNPQASKDGVNMLVARILSMLALVWYMYMYNMCSIVQKAIKLLRVFCIHSLEPWHDCLH